MGLVKTLLVSMVGFIIMTLLFELLALWVVDPRSFLPAPKNAKNDSGSSRGENVRSATQGGNTEAV